MDKKYDQDFADLEVKRLCGVFGTPIPALPPERDKALDKGNEIWRAGLFMSGSGHGLLRDFHYSGIRRCSM